MAKTEKDQPAQRREPGDSLGAKGRGSDQLGQSDATERPSKMRTGPRTEVTGDLDRNIHTQPNSMFLLLLTALVGCNSHFSQLANFKSTILMAF